MFMRLFKIAVQWPLASPLLLRTHHLLIAPLDIRACAHSAGRVMDQLQSSFQATFDSRIERLTEVEIEEVRAVRYWKYQSCCRRMITSTSRRFCMLGAL